MENLELGKLLLKTCRADPDSFSMKAWAYADSCGTVACLGGRTMLLSGYDLRFVLRKDGTSMVPAMHDRSHAPVKVTHIAHECWVFYRPDGTEVPYGCEWVEAYNLLGLTEEEFFSEDTGFPLFSAGLSEERALQRLGEIIRDTEEDDAVH